MADNWFGNGIKSVGGGVERFTEASLGDNGYLYVDKLGTYYAFDYFGGVAGTENKDPLFTSESGVRISLGITPSASIISGNTYLVNYPKDVITQYYNISDFTQDTGLAPIYVTDFRGTNGVAVSLYAKPDEGSESSLYNVGQGVYRMPTAPESVWKGTFKDFALNYWNYQIKDGRPNKDIPYYRQSASGKGFYVTWYNNEENQRLELRPIMDGYNAGGNRPGPGIQYLDTVLGEPLAYITYTQLNDPNLFDPEEDAADEWGDYSDDPSVPGGGGGVYGNYPDDPVDFPDLPTVGAIDTGFLTAYAPSSPNLQALVNYLWTSDWVDTIKKMINNPMDAIISLQMIPYSVWDMVVDSTCKIGAIETSIPMSKLTGQYKTLDCGMVNIPRNWGNALDYTNVRISIYLPFVGVRNIDTDIIMDSNLYLKYYVDIITGSAVAMLKCVKAGSSQSIYYTWDCNLNYQIPITGANYSEVIRSLMGLGTMAVGTAINPGVGAAAAAGAIQNAANVIGNKTQIESSGQLSSNVGVLSEFTPYVIVDLPTQSLPANFKHEKGYTSNITASLGSLSGYTEVEYIDLTGIDCTDEEKEDIRNLLANGIYL